MGGLSSFFVHSVLLRAMLIANYFRPTAHHKFCFASFFKLPASNRVLNYDVGEVTFITTTFFQMMKNISKEQADRIFRSLDTKGDNRVSLEEFRSGHLLNFISFEFFEKK